MQNSETILLKDIWACENISDYKVHFGRWNGEYEPLDEWVSDRCKWKGWQEYRPKSDMFNRPYIFSLMNFYHEPDAWLFGGIFRVSARHRDRYEVELMEIHETFIGRLKVRPRTSLGSPWRGRATRVNFENHYDILEVLEVLREPYSGQPFPGYESIDLPFSQLEALVRNNRTDWKTALENVHGVYLITDTRTGKRYVGSAYGEQGIWSRWVEYATSGHGWDTELRKLVEPDLGYPRKNFRFTLLEYRAARTPEKIILERETFWKKVLLAQGKYGLNLN